MSNPQKINATITENINHGDHVYSLRFRAERRMPRFKPGQFLHLAIDPFDPSTGYWPDSRVFSIATTPSPNEVTIAYSVKGSYTKRMENELQVGSNVWLKFPYGSFIIDEVLGENDPAVLVAGGTGFTPFVSFLSREAERGSSRRIVLFYGLRKPSLLLFGSVLELSQKLCPSFKLFLYMEENQLESPFAAIPGRLDVEQVTTMHRELIGAPIFLAGPPVMMDIFKKSFKAAGIPNEKILIDEWE